MREGIRQRGRRQDFRRCGSRRRRNTSRPRRVPRTGLSGFAGMRVTAIAVAMTLFHLWAAYDIVPTQQLRYIHVAFVLLLTFLLFPVANRFRNRIRLRDIIPALDRHRYYRLRALRRRRFHRPRSGARSAGRHPRRDLHRARAGSGAAHHRAGSCRSSAVLFIAYALSRAGVAGALDAPRLRSGAAGRPSLHHARRHLRRRRSTSRRRSIIMFTIYGAILHHSGAGKFFIDFSLAVMGGKPNSAGRAVVVSSFLLGEALRARASRPR